MKEVIDMVNGLQYTRDRALNPIVDDEDEELVTVGEAAKRKFVQDVTRLQEELHILNHDILYAVLEKGTSLHYSTSHNLCGRDGLTGPCSR